MDSIISRDECEQVLAAHLADQEYTFEEFDVVSLAGTVPGMMADYFSLTIHINQNGEIQKKIYFIKKMTMFHKIQEKMGKEQGAYEKEDYIYNYLIPKCNEITKTSYNVAPACYLALKNNLFVFEDLSQLGYKTNLLDHDLAHCKAALTAIAKFHASSIIYEEEQTKLTGTKFSLLKENPEIFKDSLYRLDEDYLGRKWFKNCLSTLMKIIYRSTCFDIEFMGQLDSFCNRNFYRRLSPSTIFRNVVCHGDLSRSNLLFRKTGDVIDCKLIDFQALRYNPPAHDVLAYIYLATNGVSRTEYRGTLFAHYHACLCEELAKHQISIELMKYNRFLESTEYARHPVLVQSAFYATMMPLASYPHIEKDQQLYKKYVYEDRSKECIEQFEKEGEFAKKIDEYIVELFWLRGSMERWEQTL